MYKGEFPVPGQALGYYVNCLKSDVKINLFIINKKLYDLEEKKMAPDTGVMQELQKGLNRLVYCEAVYKVVPTLESKFCKKGIDWMYTNVQLFIWLMVAMVFLGVAIGRIEILVWRKKKEIESMMESMEVRNLFFNYYFRLSIKHKDSIGILFKTVFGYYKNTKKFRLLFRINLKKQLYFIHLYSLNI